MTDRESVSPRVLMVGTGTMGSAITRALLREGHGVTVWNRTRSRLAPLVAEGAVEAETLLDGLRHADVIFVCVLDQQGSRDLLVNGDVEAALRGKTIVQFTTGIASDGRNNSSWAEEHGAQYLDIAVMAYPRDVQSGSAVILCAGDESVFSQMAPLLTTLGSARHVGTDPGRAAIFDAALIAFFYGNLVGYVHGAALIRAEGGDVSEFLDVSTSILPFFASAVRDLGERIVSGDYSQPQSSMLTHLGGIELLVLGASRDAGVRTEVMEAIRDAYLMAVTGGRGGEDIAVLIDMWQQNDVEQGTSSS
jgi:3-hydroxyisobutyrate dehydrogenase-like beta-hydroxyacid dehydrogenase